MSLKLQARKIDFIDIEWPKFDFSKIQWCRLPRLKIGNAVAKLPIVQGGMGVGISLSGLASAVANEGGIGVIAANSIRINDIISVKELLEELQKQYLCAGEKWADRIRNEYEKALDKLNYVKKDV